MVQTPTLSRLLVLEEQEWNYFIFGSLKFYFKSNITTVREIGTEKTIAHDLALHMCG